MPCLDYTYSADLRPFSSLSSELHGAYRIRSCGFSGPAGPDIQVSLAAAVEAREPTFSRAVARQRVSDLRSPGYTEKSWDTSEGDESGKPDAMSSWSATLVYSAVAITASEFFGVPRSRDAGGGGSVWSG